MTRLPPDALWSVAERIHRGGMFAAKFKTAEAVFTAMMLMQELGFEAVSGLSSIHMIHNVPALSSRALLSLVLRRGYRLAWTERSETAAEVTVTHADREGSHTVRYAIEDAKRAGLLSNRAWQTMPRSMLTARALSELVSSWCADVLGGATIYTEEEVGDFARPPTEAPAPSPKDVDAPKTLPPAVDVPDAERLSRAIQWVEARGLLEEAEKEYGPAAEWKPTDLDSVKTWAKRISGGK
jgi:hypothetical protein